VKIGYAIDPKARLGNLQTGHHVELKLLRTMPGGRDTEAQLHRHFNGLHIRGEWFHFSKEMLTINYAPQRDTPCTSAEKARRSPSLPKAGSSTPAYCPSRTPQPLGPLLKEQAASEYLGIGLSELQSRRAAGHILFVSLPNCRDNVRYTRQDLDDFRNAPMPAPGTIP
jgi:hypothetical protein